MRESVRFYTQWLIYDDKQKRLVSSPTYSPEHGPVTIGNTYEQSLIEQLYNDFITASEALGTDEELRNIVKNQVVQLKPYSVSKKTGLLKDGLRRTMITSTTARRRRITVTSRTCSVFIPARR